MANSDAFTGEAVSLDWAAQKRRFLWSLPFDVLLLYAASGLPLPPFLDGAVLGAVQLALCLPVCWVNRAVFFTAFKEGKSRAPGVNLPASLAAGAALLYSVVFLLLLCTGGDFLPPLRQNLQFASAAVLLTLAAALQRQQGGLPVNEPFGGLLRRAAGLYLLVLPGLALLTLIGWLLAGAPLFLALGRGVSVLAAGCPCALGFAIFPAAVCSLSLGVRQGVRFRGLALLETVGLADAALLERSSVVAADGLAVVKVIGTRAVPEKFLTSMAASLSAGSKDPLARAILARAEENGVHARPAADFQAFPGWGFTGKVAGKELSGGNREWTETLCALPPDLAAAGEEMAAQGILPLYFTLDHHAAGIIGVAEMVRPGSAEAIAQLRALGLEVRLLTAKAPAAETNVAAQLGLSMEEVAAGAEETLLRLHAQGRRVAVVSQNAGSVLSLSPSDIPVVVAPGPSNAADALLCGELSGLPAAVRLSRRAARTVRQNLIWALLFPVLCLPLALLPAFPPALTALPAAVGTAISAGCILAGSLKLGQPDENEVQQAGR